MGGGIGPPTGRGAAQGGLRFVFYGRVSTEDWQDPVTSRARQREQAEVLVRGHGVIVAEFFDAGQSRTVAWGRRPEAAALVALLADPDRAWDAIVVGEADFIAAQDISAARGPAPGMGLAAPHKRRYLLAGLLICGGCGRRMESAWSNGKPAYRCRHGHTTASRPGPGRLKNAYIREDRILPHLPALNLLLTEHAAGQRRRRTRRGIDVRHQASPENVIAYLREHQITLTYDPASGTLHTGTTEAAQTITLTAS